MPEEGEQEIWDAPRSRGQGLAEGARRKQRREDGIDLGASWRLRVGISVLAPRHTYMYV